MDAWITSVSALLQKGSDKVCNTDSLRRFLRRVSQRKLNPDTLPAERSLSPQRSEGSD